MINQKVAKGAIVTSFTGLASIPGLYYALVVKPVQDVESGAVKTVAAQTDTLHSATSTGRLLFGLGLFFLVVLIGFIIVGFRLQNTEINDGK